MPKIVEQKCHLYLQTNRMKKVIVNGFQLLLLIKMFKHKKPSVPHKPSA